MKFIRQTLFFISLALLTQVFFSCKEEKLKVEPPPPPPPPPVVEDTLHIEPTLKLRGYEEIDNRIGAGDYTKDTLLTLGNMHEGIWEYMLIIESYSEMGELVIENEEIKIANSLKLETWLSFAEKDSIEIQLYLTSDTFNVEEHPVTIKVKNELYSIRNWRDLQGMQYDLKGDYKLCNDIDFPERATEGFPEQGFMPIGTSGPDAAFTLNAFKGSLNGYGFAIKNFFIDRKHLNYVGLFGVLSNTSNIKDFNIELAEKQENNGIFGGSYVGGIAGYVAENCVIENCEVTGSIEGVDYVGGGVGYLCKNSMLNLCRATGDISGNKFTGGLVGYAEEGSNVSTSFTEVSVEAKSSSTGGLIGYNAGIVYDCQVGTPENYSSILGTDSVGGLIGYNTGELLGCRANTEIEARAIVGGLIGGTNQFSEITECCAKTNLQGVAVVGGLIGCNYGLIYDCYAMGQVQATSTIGGLVGEFHNTVNNSYASVDLSASGSNKGGFLGTTDGTATNCYWNATVAQVTSAIGAGSNYGIEQKNSIDFTSFDGKQMPREMFVGWDFAMIWENEVPIGINNDFPGLKRELNFQ